MNVNSGKRVFVSFEGYEGVAGFTEQNGRATLAVSGELSNLRAGMTIEVEDRSWAVEQVSASKFVRGMKLALLRSAESA